MTVEIVTCTPLLPVCGGSTLLRNVKKGRNADRQATLAPAAPRDWHILGVNADLCVKLALGLVKGFQGALTGTDRVGGNHVAHAAWRNHLYTFHPTPFLDISGLNCIHSTSWLMEHLATMSPPSPPPPPPLAAALIHLSTLEAHPSQADVAPS